MSMILRFVLFGAIAALALGRALLSGPAAGARPEWNDAAGADDRAVLERALRRPIALAQSKDGRWLFVANQRSGSISVIDLPNMRVEVELVVGRRLADLAISDDGANLVAVDEEAGELIMLDGQGSKLAPRRRLKISPTPVSVQLSRDGSRCTVASLWPRQLTIIALGAKPHIVRTIDLPFVPRNQLLVNDDKLVVTEAFGGRLAVIDLRSGAIESVRSIPGHNIRGLTLSADKSHLLLTNQMLNPLGRAQRDDIHWGNLLTNNVRSLRLALVLDPKADLLAGSDLLHLGDAEHGTGDPAGVVDCGGHLAVTLAGVSELALGRDQGDAWQYVFVGRRPTALLPSLDNRRVYVANTNSDTVCVVDLEKPKVVAEIALGPTPELSSTDRGETLFYDAKLSHDGWLSCHSCHTDGHTSSKLADTLGDGTYGTPKRILSLRGVGDTAPWAWNGAITELEKQVAQSITSTMQGRKPSPEQVRDLTAFIKTIPPAPPRMLAGNNNEAMKRGEIVFAKNNCARCHTPPTYTSAGSYDVGLVDEAGHKHFNPPSLRGVSQGGPYFHDGRAPTLSEVFARQRHQLKSVLTKQELEDLLAILGTL